MEAAVVEKVAGDFEDRRGCGQLVPNQHGLVKPGNEKTDKLRVAGYPVGGVRGPDIARKPLDEIATFM